MTTDFADQIAIITGGASGLGFAIAKRLAADGAQVALCDCVMAALGAAADSIGKQASVFFLDVTDKGEVRQRTDDIGKQFGRIDILVNSAGVTGKTNVKSHDVEANNLRFVFDVNFMGSFFTSRAALPWMLKRNYGRILHIASIAGKEGNAGMLAYSASKAAVIGMTKVQGKEYAETGITINALAP